MTSEVLSQAGQEAAPRPGHVSVMEQHDLVLLTTDDWQAISQAVRAGLDGDALDPEVTERLLALKVVEFEFVDDGL